MARCSVTSAIVIREFRDGDAEHVIAIAKDLQAHETTIHDRMKPVDEIDQTYLAALWKDVEEHGGTFLVAEFDGIVAGYCTLLTQCDSSHDKEEVFYRYSRVGDLAVSANKRSNGVGKALLAECATIATRAGIKWLSLGVLANNTRARKFYEREGFCAVSIGMDKAL
jgi:ribosomal protein S18 acetylase RimI-like enzyme